MPTENGRMTAAEFLEAIDIIGEKPSSFADLLVALGDAGENKHRTVQRWAAGTLDIPGPVQAVLQLLVLLIDHAEITPVMVRAWLADAVIEDATEGTDATP